MPNVRRVLAAVVLVVGSLTTAASASASGAGNADQPSCARLQPAAWTGTFTPGTFTAGGFTRGYCLYLPAGGLGAGRPLVVYLHGCNETAEQTAQASHFNDIADRNDFAVLYPQQNVTTNSSAPFADGNGVGCWNWFLPEDQHRDAGLRHRCRGGGRHGRDPRRDLSRPVRRRCSHCRLRLCDVW